MNKQHKPLTATQVSKNQDRMRREINRVMGRHWRRKTPIPWNYHLDPDHYFTRKDFNKVKDFLNKHARKKPIPACCNCVHGGVIDYIRICAIRKHSAEPVIIDLYKRHYLYADGNVLKYCLNYYWNGAETAVVTLKPGEQI